MRWVGGWDEDLVVEPLTVAIAVTGDKGDATVGDPEDDTKTMTGAATIEDDSATTGLTYTVSLNRASTADTTVVVALSGKATADDIESITSTGNATYSQATHKVTVVIPAGETSVSFLLNPVLETSDKAFNFEGVEDVVATITDADITNDDEPATVKADTTLPDGTVVKNDQAVGIILDGNPISLPSLDGDLTKFYGPGDVNNIGAGDTASPMNGDPILTTDFNDVVYIGYFADGSPTRSLGNLANLGDGGPNATSTDNEDSITTVDMGEGVDELLVRGAQMAGTRVYLGGGNDTYTVGQDMQLGAYAFGEDGDDTITVNGIMYGGKIYGGSGSDTITTGALADGAIIDLGTTNLPAQYLDTYMLNGQELGSDRAGDAATDVNNLTVNGNMQNVPITGGEVHIYGGAGQDNVTINGYVSNNGNSASGFTIETGEGNDNITVTEYVIGSIINAGNGDNTITIGTNTNADIISGTGNDVVTIGGNVLAGAKIETGAGDDIINLGGFMNGSIVGGDGTDIINLTGSGQQLNMSNLTGIETVNLTGTGNNTLNLGDSVASTTANILTDNPGMYVQGDAGDRVIVYPHLAWSDTGNLAKTGATTTDAAGLTYDVWQYGSDTNAVIYIQQGITVF